MPGKAGRKQKSSTEAVQPSEKIQTTADVDHAFVSSGSAKKAKARNGKLKPAMLAVLCLMVAGGVLVGWRVATRDTKQDEVNVQALLDRLAQNKNRVDYGSILPDINAAIDQAERDKNTEQLLVLYAYRAGLAASNNDPQTAIKSYKARAKLDPDVKDPDAYLLAQAYEAAGQKAEAIQNYELALTYYQQSKRSPDPVLEDTAGNDYYITVIRQKLGTLKAGGQ